MVRHQKIASPAENLRENHAKRVISERGGELSGRTNEMNLRFLRAVASMRGELFSTNERS